jgi:signal transduction histidine kinase
LSHDLNRLLLLGGAGMVGLLFAGLALATYQSTRIADAVQSLIPPALALGRGEVPKTSWLDVREADEVAQALVRAYDILQNRTFERDRAKRKEEQARVMTSMMDDFVANVSHELRTPLTSIAGSLGLLAGGASGPLPARAARLVSIAHVNAQRLVRLINDILDIGKIESGNMTFDFAAVDLRAAAEQAIDAIRAFAAIHGASIRFDALSSNCTVRADADRLTQIFTNLLSNAIKFSPKGGEVVVTIKCEAHMGCILVRDHGPGIPVEFRLRIFDKFTQAEVGDAKQKSGTGLGLNIVSKIVAQHGGTVGFNDAPGGGTIFHVEIPLWAEQPLMATQV